MKKFFYLITIFLLSIFFVGATIVSKENISPDDPTEKFVYLTFDDGPNDPVTTKVLNVLKEKDVKATFFLIGRLIESDKDLVKRIANEGHSIGLHSYTHDRAKLYKNTDSFIHEMLSTQNVIYETIGVKSNIIRFPFGANNNSFNITKEIVDKLHNYEFKIYDWNIDSGDGLNPHSEPYHIANNCKGAKNGSIILLHCSSVNKNTANALPMIIDNLKSEGFSFKTINEDTKEVYRIKKH